MKGLLQIVGAGENMDRNPSKDPLIPGAFTFFSLPILLTFLLLKLPFFSVLSKIKLDEFNILHENNIEFS